MADVESTATLKKALELLDELQSTINDSSRMPLTGKTMVDVDLVNSIIEDIKIALPRDMHEAVWLCGEKNRIIQEASEQYNRVIRSAQEQADYLVENDAITKDAQKKAKLIIQEANDKADELKEKCYNYIDVALFNLQNEVNTIHASYIAPLHEQLAKAVNEISGSLDTSFDGVQAGLTSNRNEIKELARNLRASRESQE